MNRSVRDGHFLPRYGARRKPPRSGSEERAWTTSVGEGSIPRPEAEVGQRRRRPVKLIAIAEPIEADHIEAEMRERFGDRMAVVRSHASVVEGSPLGVTKGEALRKLAAHLSIPQSQTMAIGDRDNDVTMVAWAGVGVAMRGGSPALIEIADWVAPSVEDDGVAVAIERFVLNAAAAACTSKNGAIADGSGQPDHTVENALCPSP